MIPRGQVEVKCLSVFGSNADTVLTQAACIEDGETENPHEWRGSCGLRSWRYADKGSVFLGYSMRLFTLFLRAL